MAHHHIHYNYLHLQGFLPPANKTGNGHSARMCRELRAPASSKSRALAPNLSTQTATRRSCTLMNPSFRLKHFQKQHLTASTASPSPKTWLCFPEATRNCFSIKSIYCLGHSSSKWKKEVFIYIFLSLFFFWRQGEDTMSPISVRNSS